MHPFHGENGRTCKILFANDNIIHIGILSTWYIDKFKLYNNVV